MNLKEIISRPVSDIREQDEIMFVIEQYVKEKKNVDVKIGLRDKGLLGNQIQLQLMSNMYAIAEGYFMEKFSHPDDND